MRKNLVRVGLVIVALTVSLSTALADGVLVFGGTGQLGAYHVRLLAQQGQPVTVFHRSTSSFERLGDLEYNRIEGDLLDAESVKAAMDRARPQIVIDTSARRGGVDAGDPFYSKAMSNIVQAAAAGDVKHIVIHSSIGVRASAAPLKEKYGYDTASANMRDKAEAEVILEDGGIPYTIIRNGLLEFEPVAATGRGRLTDDETVFGRITRADLARLTMTCVDNPDCFGKIFHAIDDGLTGPRPRHGAD